MQREIYQLQMHEDTCDLSTSVFYSCHSHSQQRYQDQHESRTEYDPGNGTQHSIHRVETDELWQEVILSQTRSEVYALNYNRQTNTTINDHLAIFAGYYASIGGLRSMQVFSFSRRSHSGQSEGQTCRWGERWWAALRTPWRRYLKCLHVIVKCDPPSRQCSPDSPANFSLQFKPPGVGGSTTYSPCRISLVSWSCSSKGCRWEYTSSSLYQYNCCTKPTMQSELSRHSITFSLSISTR